MQFLKKVFRNIFRVILGLILFVLLYLSLSWLLPFVKLSRTVQHPDQGIELFIQSNGVHTDFAMPVRTNLMDWNRFLPCSDFEVADPSFKYIAMGWGDKGFFIGTPTWDDLKFSTVFNAAFGLSSAAMHVTYKKNKPKENNSCKKII